MDVFFYPSTKATYCKQRHSIIQNKERDIEKRLEVASARNKWDFGAA